jgi:hypothetical protein
MNVLVVKPFLSWMIFWGTIKSKSNLKTNNKDHGQSSQGGGNNPVSPPPHAQFFNFRVYKARRIFYDASSPTMPNHQGIYAPTEERRSFLLG